ncbi:hypothetical protein Tco_0596382 [Tanacetum coccineum]
MVNTKVVFVVCNLAAAQDLQALWGAYMTGMERGFLSQKGWGEDEHVVASGNNMHTEDGNVRQGVTSITTTAPNIGFVSITIHESPATHNFASIRSGPTLYAKLVTGEPSRKSVNLRNFNCIGGKRGGCGYTFGVYLSY